MTRERFRQVRPPCCCASCTAFTLWCYTARVICSHAEHDVKKKKTSTELVLSQPSRLDVLETADTVDTHAEYRQDRPPRSAAAGFLSYPQLILSLLIMPPIITAASPRNSHPHNFEPAATTALVSTKRRKNTSLTAADRGKC